MSARLSRRAALSLLLAASCSRRPARTGALERVVSLSPSTTEAMGALGALAQLVGRSRYCDYPKEVLALPEVGGYVDPNLEAIVALSPDLVCGARGPAGASIAKELEDRGIATYFPPTETFAEIEAMLRGLGERLARDAEVLPVLDAMHAQENAIERALSDVPRLRVLLLFGVEPIVASGPGSFGHDVLTHAHATNVVVRGGTYPSLDLEAVLALDPDVVVNAAVAEEHGAQRIAKTAPGWKDARAVKADKVLMDIDQNARAAYELRASHSTTAELADAETKQLEDSTKS
jgi:iron complex transport system substrate-binding protein